MKKSKSSNESLNKYLKEIGNEVETIQKFHDLFYKQLHHKEVKYMYICEDSTKPWAHEFVLQDGNIPLYKGVGMYKNPLDLWIYQEIIWETKPDTIVELGTMFGGSAMYLADLMPNGKVVTVDNGKLIHFMPRFKQENIIPILGDVFDKEVFEQVKFYATGRTMIILDTDHDYEHVLKEMELYAPLVTKGCYMIVEDTDTIPSDGGRGPLEAIKDYFKDHSDFKVDLDRHRFLITFHPQGFLRKMV
jgi:cephalosporin hydroxylase